MTHAEMVIYREWGWLPGINESFVIYPAKYDDGPSLEVITHREFNIEDQIHAEFWYNWRTEYWPDTAY